MSDLDPIAPGSSFCSVFVGAGLVGIIVDPVTATAISDGCVPDLVDRDRIARAAVEAAGQPDPSAPKTGRHLSAVPSKTYGERMDDISGRLDAAYAARGKCQPGTLEYDLADGDLGIVYDDLRALNEEIAAR